jgi:hypothetical protein
MVRFDPLWVGEDVVLASGDCYRQSRIEVELGSPPARRTGVDPAP